MPDFVLEVLKETFQRVRNPSEVSVDGSLGILCDNEDMFQTPPSGSLCVSVIDSPAGMVMVLTSLLLCRACVYV